VRLDELDRKILDHLERDGRATLADVGAAVGLSASAVKRRVDRLESAGVIVGYAAIVDPAAVGDRLEAFVELYCADSVAPGGRGRRGRGGPRSRRGDRGARADDRAPAARPQGDAHAHDGRALDARRAPLTVA
jgi:DNA-binding Lrp family transcriptional regulator